MEFLRSRQHCFFEDIKGTRENPACFRKGRQKFRLKFAPDRVILRSYPKRNEDLPMGLLGLLFRNPAAFILLIIPLFYSMIIHELAHG